MLILTPEIQIKFFRIILCLGIALNSTTVTILKCQNSKLDTSIYIIDTLFLRINEIVDKDTSIDLFRFAMIKSNIASCIASNIQKEDSFYSYIKWIYSQCPHEMHFFDYTNSEEFKQVILKRNLAIGLKTFTYINQINDSIEGTYNKALQKKLANMLEGQIKDKQILEDIINKRVLDKEFKKQLQNINKNKIKRLIQLDSIFIKYGYPGKSIVGTKCSSYAILILENYNYNELYKYLNLITDACLKGELYKASYASFIDHFFILTGRKQIFGTQTIIINKIKHILPVGNNKELHKRRDKYGLTPLYLVSNTRVK